MTIDHHFIGTALINKKIGFIVLPASFRDRYNENIPI